MILDDSTKHRDMFNIDCTVEELVQVVTTAWSDLIPDGGVLSLSYNGGCGSYHIIDVAVLTFFSHCDIIVHVIQCMYNNVLILWLYYVCIIQWL